MKVGDILIRNANKFPEKIALVSDDFSQDYRTLNTRVFFFVKD